MIRETKQTFTVGMLCLAALLCGRLALAQSGRDFLEAAGVKGGLVVHLGCGDGTLTADLLAGDRYLVHGLDTDRNNVERARRHIQSLGRYGGVSVDAYDGEHLPYVDNVVNLVVVSRPDPSQSVCRVSPAELLRALCPQDRITCAFGQLESLWPVNGSVLVLNDIAYVSAGRSTFLDGGIFLVGLDPATGRKLYETVLSGPYEEDAGEPIINTTRHTSIHGNKNDILVTDGKYIYLSHMAFHPDLTPMDDREENRDHLLSASFLLDDTGHHRSFWTVAAVVPFDNDMPKLRVPDGDMLVVDGEHIYGFRAHPAARDARKKFDPLTEGFTLFAMTRGEAQKPVKRWPRKGEKDPKTIPSVSRHRYDTDWTVFSGINGQAITIDEKRLFVAGKPGVFPQDDIFKAVEGRMGGLFVVASREDGSELARYELEAVPVWDGMATANGRLIMCLKNGTVVCWEPKG